MQSFSAAVRSKVNSLSLQCFPSGLGPWREDGENMDTSNIKHGKNHKNVENYFSVTLRNDNPNYEKIETLKEYVSQKRSPWLMDYDWSNEAQSLREISIETPWKLTGSFIKKHFRTLRLLDSQINELDDGLKDFVNLDTLILSSNFITTVPAQNLPAGLKTVELSGNFISNIDSLTQPVPPPKHLQHLGLSNNQIENMNNSLTNRFWPSLISLDISDNHLDDILPLMNNLSQLPKLRNLCLSGNPLALLPYYRGYTIDTIKNLLVLDEARISADERHHYRGMSRRQGTFAENVNVTFKVSKIRFIPPPDEVKNPGEQPEIPVISRKYCLRFWVPSSDISSSENSSDTKSEAVEETPEECIIINPPEKFRRLPNGCSLESLVTSFVAYAPDEIPLEWTHTISSPKLKVWRDFMIHSLQFDLMEEKSLLYPPDELPKEVHEVPVNSLYPPAGGKGGKASNKAGGGPNKGKDDTSTAAVAENDKKKKKKMDESQLVVYSKEWRTLATFRTDCMAELVRGGSNKEFTVRDRVNAPLLNDASKLRHPSLGSGLATGPSKSKSKEAIYKSEKKSAKGPQQAPPSARKKPLPTKGKVIEEFEPEEVVEAAAVILETEVEFHLLHWKNTRESVSPEEMHTRTT